MITILLGKTKTTQLVDSLENVTIGRSMTMSIDKRSSLSTTHPMETNSAIATMTMAVAVIVITGVFKVLREDKMQMPTP